MILVEFFFRLYMDQAVGEVHLTVILRTRVVYRLIADEVRIAPSWLSDIYDESE